MATGLTDLIEAMSGEDLAWAQPYVEQARVSMERGDVISGEEFFERLESKLSSLRSA